MKSAFDRWDAVSAVRFTHSPQDDGVALGSFAGVNGVRGDHRIGGHHLDGTTSPTFVAYNFFPNNADMVIDTDEVGRMGNPNNNFVLFRNTLMHEIGHGLGLNHPASSDSRFLMEGILDGTIDGPQLDDILGIHRLYGDRYEEFGGNDTGDGPAFFVMLPLCWCIGSFVSTRLIRRVGENRLVLVGAVGVTVLAFAMLALLAVLPVPAFGLFAMVALMHVVQALAMPALQVRALGADPRLIGSASGLMGFLQMAAGAVATVVVGQLYDGSAIPSAGALVFTSVTALSLLLWQRRARIGSPA